MSDIPVRHTSRLIILDPADRILLIQYATPRDVDPARPGLRAIWYTPGGGIEPGETPEAAARRELIEETGIADAAIGPCVARRSALVDVFLRTAYTHERYFLVRAPSEAFDMSGLAETDIDPVRAVRWIDALELTRLDAPLLPPELPDLYARLIAEGPPPEPIVLAR